MEGLKPPHTGRRTDMAELDMSWETEETIVRPNETEERDFSDFEI